MYLIGKDRSGESREFERDILRSPDLEMELSGFEERGVRPPIVRIPIKTHLSSVILSNNPWEERELEKKLEQIRQERRRRENTLNWFQRQFFVNQVFDQDDRLRFAGDAAEDLTATKGKGSREAPPSGKPRRQKSRRRSLAKTPKYPKPESLQCRSVERLNDSSKVDATYKLRRPPVISEEESNLHKWDSDLDDLDSIATISPAPREPKNGVKLPVIKMQALGIFASAGKRSTRSSKKSARMTGKLPDVAKQGLKSATCHPSDILKQNIGDRFHTKPNNDDNFSVHSYDDESDNLFLTDRRSACADDAQRCLESVRNTPPQASHFGSDPKIGLQLSANRRKSLPSLKQGDFERPRENIDGIVMRLTQALPPKLMANAHENANRLLYGRRKMMTEISRQESSRNTMDDPRWRKLVDSLVNNT
ncbi:uncharacterized protein LOC135502287 isoform X2 [Lineus longissimus]|uniref:uncharacterized protein LOC135502287 isoform X2 n=1 Tax=Lineus longissimus TaxID=88925 RepID=UPI00315DC1E6